MEIANRAVGALDVNRGHAQSLLHCQSTQPATYTLMVQLAGGPAARLYLDLRAFTSPYRNDHCLVVEKYRPSRDDEPRAAVNVPHKIAKDARQRWPGAVHR